jgi:hypothetical protein
MDNPSAPEPVDHKGGISQLAPRIELDVSGHPGMFDPPKCPDHVRRRPVRKLGPGCH